MLALLSSCALAPHVRHSRPRHRPAISCAAPPFEQWASARGINAPKLYISDTETLRGVLALEPIRAGEELCVVPRPCTLDLAAAEGAGSPIPELVPTPLWSSLRWFERLGLWLLAEYRRGGDSTVSG